MARLFLNNFQQLRNLDLKVGASLGKPVLYHIIGSLAKDSQEKFEEESMKNCYEDLDVEEYFEHLRRFLKLLVLKRQNQQHKLNLRRMLATTPNPDSPKDQNNGNQPKKWEKKTWSKSSNPRDQGNGSGDQKHQKPARKCWYCGRQDCYLTKCQLLKTHLINKSDVYEGIRAKNLCLGCMQKMDNNPDGAHSCQLLKSRPGKPVFNVLCEISVRPFAVVGLPN